VVGKCTFKKGGVRGRQAGLLEEDTKGEFELVTGRGQVTEGSGIATLAWSRIT